MNHGAPTLHYRREKEDCKGGEEGIVTSVDVKYNVDRRCIRDWVHQDNVGAFDEESPSRFRLGWGVHRVACEELDSLLIAEVLTPTERK